jgi:FKBP-type peptidyl-prolyl cis-trans isomerase
MLIGFFINNSMKNILLLILFFVSITSYAQQDTVFCASGLKYVRLKEGKGEKPAEGQRVKVTYVGKLLNGEIFQALEKGDVFMFKIGDPGIIKGWNEGFQLMKEGEKGILIVPPFLGYGTKGVKDPEEIKEYMVPPNAMLVFEVELISIK